MTSRNVYAAAYNATNIYSDTGKQFTAWRKQWGNGWNQERASESCDSLKRRKAKREYYEKWGSNR